MRLNSVYRVVRIYTFNEKKVEIQNYLGITSTADRRITQDFIPLAALQIFLTNLLLTVVVTSLED